jgi:inner membrane protein
LDNLTHSLVGVALADLTLRDTAAPSERRLFVAAGVVASNAPDLDLLYLRITPPPLGYLLHHRGYSHTIAGLLLLAVLLPLTLRVWTTTRRLGSADAVRLLGLIWISLAGHVMFDALNSYGIHPFYPFDVQWYYADAVFIFEPWVWLILGISAAWALRNRTARFAMLTLIAVLPILFTFLGVMPIGALVMLIIAGRAFVWAASRLSSRTRAAGALAITVLGCAGMFALSRAVEAATRAALAPTVRGAILDVIRTPNPSSPLCWSVITVEKNEIEDTVVLRRGTMSLLPAWQPPTSCASWRFTRRALDRARDRPARIDPDGNRMSAPTARPAGAERGTGAPASDGDGGSGGAKPPGLVWTDEIRESLTGLRDLAAQDCWARAWLQFGRAPVVRDGRLYDLRFDTGTGRNFTTLTLATERDAGCPPHVTPWAMPRADLVGGN